LIHRNAPLSVEGRRRLVERYRTRPIAHVAAEMGISRATASKWVNRYRQFGELGLRDRSSAPRRQPSVTPGDVVGRIEGCAGNTNGQLRASRSSSIAPGLTSVVGP
jgi:transposase-like protein